ncbi:hypothetical protein PAHAL_2G025000 [Panicum hallii]|uniref:Cell differentiation protein rcd1 n=1 Tax=Panicum hallii TaxID=206008 RepID=A0A2S3GVG9_9POAL|nr:CCR4-NOT transcription complex subunit 9-like [Panicum hallii]PAN09463.1 hypothetical protein PAHAL_2G025000 [Panicum hallii]
MPFPSYARKRGMFKDLAPMLWYSFGTMAALLQEVVLVYPTLSSPTLSANASSRVCNALGLLQTVAAHPVTRTPLLAARIPLYLYPFLNTTSKAKSYEYLRLASLNVIDALVKVDDTEAVNFLVTSQVIPLCLRIMETDSELPKLVATSIVKRIMLDEFGLQYICATADRFFQAAMALATMVNALAEQPSARLLKHVVRCYLRLTDNPRARAALQICLPKPLKDGAFDNCLQDDPATRCCLQQLLDNLGAPAGGGAPRPGAGGSAAAGGGARHPGPGPAARGSRGGGSSSQAGPSRAPWM